MSLDLYLAIVVFIFGACLGSFFNVVVLRGFSGESIVLPPSKCPFCKTKLKWFHNVPILSYLFLRGKCAFCKEKISFQYPLVEFITAVLYLILYLRFGVNLNFIFLCIISSILLLYTITDFKEKVIFVEHSYLLIIVGIIYNFFNIGAFSEGYGSFFQSFIGIVGGFLIFEGLVFIFKPLFKKRCFGEGDAYIAASLGAVLGIKTLIMVIFFAIFFQALFVLPIFVFSLLKNKEFKLFLLMSLFFIFAGVMYYCQHNLIFPQMFYWGALSLVLVTAIAIIINLKNIKTESLKFIQIPFGPALSIAGFLFIAQYLSFKDVYNFLIRAIFSI